MRLRPATLVALAGTALACGEPRPSTIVENAVRDSAGIRIVENAAPRLPRPWHLAAEPVVTISGNGPPEETPLDPVSVFETESGLLVVGDGDQSGWDAMLVYGRDGSFLRKIGGSGQGPGEFGQLWWAAPYRGDSLIAMDQRGEIVRVFDERGAFARDVVGPRSGGPEPPAGTYGYVPGFIPGSYADGSFLAFGSGILDISGGAGPVWYVHDLIRIDATGAVSDTLGEFPIDERHWDGERQRDYLFGDRAFKRPLGSSTIVGTNSRFEFRIRDDAWDLTTIVRRSHVPEPVTEEDREEFLAWWVAAVRRSREFDEAAMARYRSEFQDTPAAPTKPAYDAILADDEGRIWVQEFRWILEDALPPDPRPGRWSIFAPDGTWLTTVETPADFIVSSVSGDRVFGFRMDPFDLVHIEVYELRAGAQVPGVR